MRKNLTIEEVDAFIVRWLAKYLSRFNRACLKQLLRDENQKLTAEAVRNNYFRSDIYPDTTDKELKLYYYCYFRASNKHWKLAINRLLKAGRYHGRTKKRKS